MAVNKLGKVPAGKSKPVPKGARVILIHQRAHSNRLATRKGRVREGTSKRDAEKVLLNLAKSWRHTALLVDGKGKIILSAKGGKRGGKTKTSAKIAKIAATTKGKVQLLRRRSDGAVVHSKSATKSAISSWKQMPHGSYLLVAGSDRNMIKSRKSASSAKKKTSRK